MKINKIAIKYILIVNLDMIENKWMDLGNEVNKDIKLNSKINLYKIGSIKEDIKYLNNVFNQEPNEALFDNLNKIDNYTYEKTDSEDQNYLINK